MKSDLFSKLNFWFSSCTSRGAMCDTSRSQITESECKTKKVKETSSLFFCQWLQQPKIRATYDSRIPGWAWIAIPRQWDPKNTIQGINQGGGGRKSWLELIHWPPDTSDMQPKFTFDRGNPKATLMQVSPISFFVSEFWNIRRPCSAVRKTLPTWWPWMPASEVTSDGASEANGVWGINVRR